MRTLEEQFGNSKAMRLRKLQHRINEIKRIAPGMTLHRHELIQAIDAGLLIAPQLLLSALLESNVRELILRIKSVQLSEADLEEGKNPRWGFSLMIDAITEHDLLNTSQSRRMKAYYKEVRIPLHHGLPRRSARLFGHYGIEDLLGCASRDHNLELSFETKGITMIRRGVELLEVIENIYKK